MYSLTKICIDQVMHIYTLITGNSICDQACKNRACGHTKFDPFSKVLLAITFYSTIVCWLWNFTDCSKFIWLCKASYRMEIFYSSNKIWLVKQQLRYILCLNARFSQAQSHFVLFTISVFSYFLCSAGIASLPSSGAYSASKQALRGNQYVCKVSSLYCSLLLGHFGSLNMEFEMRNDNVSITIMPLGLVYILSLHYDVSPQLT